MNELEKLLGYKFKNKALMERALTHSSFANERGAGRAACNERLEFLGDSLLGFLTADYLFNNYPDKPEGEMTRLRAELVCESSLVKAAVELNLGKWLRLGKGEEQGGGRSRPSILADAVEALLAALYLDGGEETARSYVKKYVLAALEKETEARAKDYKSALQELVQRDRTEAPVYRLSGESGPDHMKTFTAEVLINGSVAGEGKGRTKKEAEQAAAGDALMRLQGKA
jgi:ribonuclease-3